MSDQFYKSKCNPDVASAVANVSRQQGGTVGSDRRLGPDKMVGGLGVAGLYSTEGRYDGSELDPPPRSRASSDTFHNEDYGHDMSGCCYDW